MRPEERSALREQLIVNEGLRLKPYLDSVGKTTIGVGRNLTDNGLSLPEVMVLLDNDINAAFAGLSARLAWFPLLDPMRQRVLIDLAFNMGCEKVMGFRKMLHAIADKDWDRAADELLDSTYARQVGPRAQRLATMLRTGRAA